MTTAHKCRFCQRSFPPRTKGGNAKEFCSPSCRSKYWSGARRWVEKARAMGLVTDADKEGRPTWRSGPVETGGWMPIETAPKDGSYFLIAGDFGILIAGYVGIVETDTPEERKCLAEAFGHEPLYGECWAKYWLPLPEPPE